jgi:sec-independent protein translocase protein TatA
MLVGNTELLVVFALIVLLFGANKLPELARSLGRAKVEFKRGMEDEGSRK